MRTIAHRLAAVGATAVVVAGSTLAAAPAPAQAAGASPVSSPNWYGFEQSTYETLPGPVLLADTFDAEGDLLTVEWLTSPEPGMTLASDGAISWQVPSDFCGTLALDYRAFDGTSYGNVTTVELWAFTADGSEAVDCEVSEPEPPAPTNSAPVAVPNVYSMFQGATLVVPEHLGLFANDSDADGDPLTLVALEAPPLADSYLLPLAGGAFEFTAPKDFEGTYTFTYQVTDGTANSAITTVDIAVYDNPAPQVVADEYEMLEGQILTVTGQDQPTANDFDPNGDSPKMIEFSVDGPHAVLSWDQDGDFVFEPAAGFTGVVTGRYTTTDGVNVIEDVPFTITVLPAPQEVVIDAVDDDFYAEPGETIDVPGSWGPLSNDVHSEGWSLLIEESSAPSSGTLVMLEDGSFQFVAPADFCDVATFTYRATDGEAVSEPATVTIIASISGNGVECEEPGPIDDPVDPADPVDPSEPTTPTVPTRPELPTTPEQPELPTQPLDPADPANPADPQPELAATPREQLALTGAPEQLLAGLGTGALLALLLGAGAVATGVRRRVRDAR